MRQSPGGHSSSSSKTTTDSSMTKGDNDLSVAAWSCHNQCCPPPRLEAKTSAIPPHRHFLVLAVGQKRVLKLTPQTEGFSPLVWASSRLLGAESIPSRAQIPKDGTSLHGVARGPVLGLLQCSSLKTTRRCPRHLTGRYGAIDFGSVYLAPPAAMGWEPARRSALACCGRHDRPELHGRGCASGYVPRTTRCRHCSQ